MGICANTLMILYKSHKIPCSAHQILHTSNLKFQGNETIISLKSIDAF
jgi:hypothetical protein